ncbi:hypothetical protein [uncultured Roseobacter sp.]|uniref:hypothetical protein n=1 Tax=uncultured Roseobacter sp. TaxID=114847 RepID=UPI00261B586E|nr:hypothetical protein [uncultured Roseobacter sp.]
MSGVTQGAPAIDRLTFSFNFFDGSDHEVCPTLFSDGYTRALMERLRDLSSWTMTEFRGSRSKSIRSHGVEWSRTSRPDGFTHLNEQFEAYEPWQFSITSNAHGRVFGLIIGNCFHVIWLDCNHAVYP